MKSISDWLDRNTPLPSGSELSEELQALMNYVKQVGDIRAIAEIAEADVLDGDAPMSANPIYQAAYKAAQHFHSSRSRTC